MDQTARALVLTAAAPWASNAGVSSHERSFPNIGFAIRRIQADMVLQISAMLRIWEKFAA